MPNVSFNEMKEGPKKETKKEVSTIVAEIIPAAEKPKQELATTSEGAISGLSGDFQATDIRLPRLNLVQKTSEVVNAGVKPGSVIFKTGDNILVLDLPAPATILALRKQYQENLPFGTDQTPQTFDTVDEVRQAGGSLTWGSENHYKEIAHVQVLFEAPAAATEEELELFPYVFGGKSYAVAMMTLAGSAYTNGAKPIITAMLSHLRGKHWTGKWALSSELKKDARNSWHVPIFKMAGKHDPEFAEFAQSLCPN